MARRSRHSLCSAGYPVNADACERCGATSDQPCKLVSRMTPEEILENEDAYLAGREAPLCRQAPSASDPIKTPRDALRYYHNPAEILEALDLAGFALAPKGENERLRQALQDIVARAPRTKPEPAFDSKWMSYRSEGNTDDIVSDVRADERWAAAEIAGSALFETRQEG